VPGIRTHRATFSNGAENEIFTERRIIKAEACERADRWLLANNPRCRLIRQRFLPDQVLAIQGTHAPIDGLAGRTLIGCAKSNAVATTVMAPSAIVFQLAHWTLSLAARGDSFSFDLLFSARDRLASDLAK